MNIDNWVAATGIIVSALFAGVGLILNWTAVRRSNRIAVSTKLAEAYKLLSDEVVALSRVRSEHVKELEETETRPDTDDKRVQKKLHSLRAYLAKIDSKQAENDAASDEVDKMFQNLNKVSPGYVDGMIAHFYRAQLTASNVREYTLELKARNEKAKF